MNDVCNIKNQQFISHTFRNMNQKKEKIWCLKTTLRGSDQIREESNERERQDDFSRSLPKCMGP